MVDLKETLKICEEFVSHLAERFFARHIAILDICASIPYLNAVASIELLFFSRSAVMSISSASHQKTVYFGPVRVDFATRRVSGHGTTSRLSPKAARVLTRLIDANGEVISRDDLLKDVWPNIHVGEEVLTQAIAELRRGFGDKARQPKYIETISKTGYRLLVVPMPEPEAVVAQKTSPDWLETDAVPAGPSLIVLPFKSLTTDVQAQSIATGVWRDTSVTLARSRWLFVTGRGSALALEEQDTDPIRVANNLGVRYALSGWVLANDGRLRASVQLCDAVSGRMIWAETFEREFLALFEVIDSISKEIGKAVISSLEAHLRTVARLKPIEQLDAWGLYHRAEGPSRYASTPDDLMQSHSILSKAAELAPDAARISGALASLEFRRQLLFEPPTKHDALHRCIDLAGRAIELDPDEPDALVPMGCAMGAMGDRENGLAHLRRAVFLNPSSYSARSFLAWALLFVGQNADALAHVDAAEKISPIDPASFHMKAIQAHALALGGQHEAAYLAAEASDLHPRSSHLASAIAAWCAVAAGLEDRAKFHVERLRSARSDFELSHYFALFPFEGETRETIAGHLRAAGL